MRELSLNVMDVVQNSISADAKLITIEVCEDIPGDRLSITVRDDGRGMSEEQVQKVIDPFYTTRTTRSVGLGVPLFKMEAEMTGGSLKIDSALGTGTTLQAVFIPFSVYMVSLCDINAVILLLVSCNPDLDFLFTRKRFEDTEKQFALDTKELKEIMGTDVPLNSPEVVQWVTEFLKENTDQLLGKENEK